MSTNLIIFLLSALGLASVFYCFTKTIYYIKNNYLQKRNLKNKPSQRLLHFVGKHWVIFAVLNMTICPIMFAAITKYFLNTIYVNVGFTVGSCVGVILTFMLFPLIPEPDYPWNKKDDS